MSKKKGGEKKKEKKNEPSLINMADIANMTNQEKDSLRQELQSLKQENCYYKDEIFQLNEDIRIETLMNTQLYRKLLENKKQTETNFEDTQKELEQLKQQYQDEINNSQQNNKQEFNTKQDGYVYDSSLKERQIDEIKFKLVDYQESRESEAFYQKTIADLQEESKKLQWDHHENMREKEKNFYREKSKMEVIYRTKVDEQSKNALKQAQEEVLQIEEHIDQKNVVLFNELNGHQKVIGSLKGQNNRIQERHEVIRRDLQLNQDELNEYDVLNLKNQKQIQGLKAQLNYIRHFISGEVQNYTKEIQIEKLQAKERNDHMSAQIQMLTQSLYEENLKYGKAKCLAKTILDQRSLTEQFFIDSIEKISHMPAQEPNESSYQQSSLGKSKIDIDTLDLKEKQKVLRVLYYKVNQGKKKNPNWNNLLIINQKPTENQKDTDNILQRLSKDEIDR